LLKQTQLGSAAGTVFGEDLPRMNGQYFLKGTEICRIAATNELLSFRMAKSIRFPTFRA
jgi:hypothetical protein